MTVDLFLQITTISSAILLIAGILLQQRGASLGAGFGSSGELYTSRRGLDKNLYEVSIVFATVFVLSILAGLILPVINL